MSREELLRATLRLHLADGIGAVLLRRLIRRFGDAERAVAAGAVGWRKVAGIGEKTVAAMAAVTDADVSAELAEAERHGVRILLLDDAEYPAALKNIHTPPQVLYVRGRLEPTDAVAMGVVGSRRCTHYGLEQAERFGRLLARAGFTVVSGGARGIDAAAHGGALSGEGRTVAVMGCGLSTLYPPENAELFERIVASDAGALVSELPMRTAVLSGNFPTRNRIIAGMSLGVLVVEAAARSGALITAEEADEEGRAVFAVPGRADSPMSRGVNELIRDGAVLVQDLDDILDHLGEVGAKMTPAEEPTEVVPAGMDDTESALHAALADGPMALDELVRKTGLDSGRAASAMTMLVLKGAIEQRPGNVFARRKR
ncbi:MAG: DNA-processing protein DprA [Phycisphaerae bacterium]